MKSETGNYLFRASNHASSPQHLLRNSHGNLHPTLPVGTIRGAFNTIHPAPNPSNNRNCYRLFIGDARQNPPIQDLDFPLDIYNIYWS